MRLVRVFLLSRISHILLETACKDLFSDYYWRIAVICQVFIDFFDLGDDGEGLAAEKSSYCGSVRVCSGSHRSAATMRKEGSAEFRRARVPSFPGVRRV